MVTSSDRIQIEEWSQAVIVFRLRNGYKQWSYSDSGMVTSSNFIQMRNGYKQWMVTSSNFIQIQEWLQAVILFRLRNGYKQWS